MVISDSVLGLDSIALECGTDKASDGHKYCAHYESLFKHLRDKPITLLEIGVDKGNSLAMWERWMPYAKIHGIDLDQRCMIYQEGRKRIFIGNQNDTAFLGSVAQSTGPIDIIIDDGSHMASDFMTSWTFLWPYLNVNGFYCIEDMGTCACNLEQFKGNDKAGEWFSHLMLDLLFHRECGMKAIHIFDSLIVMQNN